MDNTIGLEDIQTLDTIRNADPGLRAVEISGGQQLVCALSRVEACSIAILAYQLIRASPDFSIFDHGKPMEM